jgi:Uma2 family endonuclease
MSTGALISVSEYLNTSYRPDCDYVDGEVRERNLGENEHARLQTEISAWFANHKREWNIISVVEQRIQVSARRFRIPDVSVLSRDQPMEPIVRVPPIVCCEVLSRSDSKKEMRERCDDYLAFGVQHVWVFDPLKREAFVCDAQGLHAPEGERLNVPGTPIYLPLKQIFAELD